MTISAALTASSRCFSLKTSSKIPLALRWFFVNFCADSKEISPMVMCKFSELDFSIRYRINDVVDLPAPIINMFLIGCVFVNLMLNYNHTNLLNNKYFRDEF